MPTEANKFFAKAVIKDLMQNLRSEFPAAVFKTKWGVTPYGKLHATVTGEGQVAVWQMDRLANIHTNRYVVIQTEAKTYNLI